jgi:hypothetical protein
MAELTLESLAKRIDAIEQKLSEQAVKPHDLPSCTLPNLVQLPSRPFLR